MARRRLVDAEKINFYKNMTVNEQSRGGQMSSRSIVLSLYMLKPLNPSLWYMIHWTHPNLKYVNNSKVNVFLKPPLRFVFFFGLLCLLFCPFTFWHSLLQTVPGVLILVLYNIVYTVFTQFYILIGQWNEIFLISVIIKVSISTINLSRS